MNAALQPAGSRPTRSSDRELAMSELGRGKERAGGGNRFGRSVVACGCAAPIGCSHVDHPGVLAGTSSVSSHPSGPPSTIAGGGAVVILERLVVLLRI